MVMTLTPLFWRIGAGTGGGGAAEPEPELPDALQPLLPSVSIAKEGASQARRVLDFAARRQQGCWGKRAARKTAVLLLH
jgi:hypothetical protein